MSKFINFDKMVPEDRKFILGGKEFSVPGSLSVKDVVKISQTGQKVQENPNSLEQALKETWEVLKPYNPERKDADFLDKIKVDMISPLLEFIFQNKGGEEEGEVYDNRGE